MLSTFIFASRTLIVPSHSDRVFGLIARAVNGASPAYKFNSASAKAS